MHGKPVKYSHVKGILQCTKMQELIYYGTYWFDRKKKRSVEWWNKKVLVSLELVS